MNPYTSDQDNSYSSSDFDLSQIFIGRDQQMDLFSLYLNRWKRIMAAAATSEHIVTTAPNPNNKIQGLVALLYGRGGFGKSTLLQHYRKMALEQDGHLVVSKIIDWEIAVETKRGLFNPAPGQQVDSSEYFKLLCSELAKAFGKDISDFREYKKAIDAVQNARRDARNMLDNLQDDDRYAWLRKIASEEVVTLLRGVIPGANLVPGINQIADSAKEGLDQAMKIGADQAKQLYTKLSGRLKGKLDDYLEPTLKLGLSLGRDLSNFAKNRPLLIFCDTYEEIDEGDPLLRLVIAAAGVRVGWVLAGRDNLWAGLEQRRRSLGLEYGYKDIIPSDRGLAIDFNVGGVGAFTVSDIVEYFSQLSERRSTQPLVLTITEEDASRILEATQGVPLAIKIAAGLYLRTSDVDLITEKAGKNSEIVEVMMLRYILHTRLDSGERAKLYGLALLRRADKPAAIIAALNLSPEQAKVGYTAELSRLQRRYSFIFTEKDQPSLHQEVRYFLRRWLLEHYDEPEVVAVNERLKAAHESVLKKLEASRQYSSLRDRLEDEEWVGVYLDLIEQQFWLDPVQGVNYCLPFMFAAAIYLRDINQDASDVGEFFVTKITQPYLNWWNWTTDSLVYSTSKNPSSKELNGLQNLTTLANQRCPTFPQPLPNSQTELEAALCWRLGEAHQGQDDITALEWYEKALTRLSQQQQLREDAAKAAFDAAEKLDEEKRPTECIALLNRAIELKPDYTWAYNNRGNAYNALKEYRQAINDFDQAIALDPTSIPPYNNRGNAYNYLKEYQRAIQDYTHALELDPDLSEPYNGIGFAYGHQKEFQLAIENYNRAIELNPKNTLAYNNRGLAYSGLKEFQFAIENYSHAIELDPNDATYYNNRGNAYRNLKEFQLAIENYSHAIELDPNDATYYNNRGNAYRNLKEFQLAIEDYSHAIELDPNDTDYYYNRGLTYCDLKDYQFAIPDYTSVIELDPNDATAYNDRGNAHSDLKQFQLAIEDYSHAIGLDPKSTNYYHNRGLAYSDMKQFQLAIEDYSHAIELDSKNTDSYNNRGIAYKNLKEFQLAIEDYSHAIELNPNYTFAYYNQGLAYSDMKEFQLAIENYSHAIELNPNYTFAYYNRGLAYSDMKQFQIAIKDYTRAIELDPHDTDYYIDRGNAYSDLKEFQLAIEDYSHAIKLDPDYALAHSNQGLAHLWLGNTQQAKNAYRRSWELDRTDINAPWMAEWIEMGKERITMEKATLLEEIAAANPQVDIAYVCRGVASGLRNKLKEGLADLEQATLLEPVWWDVFFWKGIMCAYLGRNVMAMEALEKALELDLPPLLLTPLYWLEKDRPQFFSEYAAPLLARYHV